MWNRGSSRRWHLRKLRARRLLPICRPWRRLACPDSTPACGSESWAPRVYRTRSSKNSLARSTKRLGMTRKQKSGTASSPPPAFVIDLECEQESDMAKLRAVECREFIKAAIEKADET